MRLIALFSGGKDSTYAMWKAIKEGHEIAYLATVHSKNPDSYMYDTSNIGFTVLQAQAMTLQIVSKETYGEKEREVDDLKVLLHGLQAEGVVCGALESEYQRKRVQKVCDELGLKLLAPLWHTDVEKYLRNMIDDGFEVVITRVQAEGFDESWLGRVIDNKAVDDLIDLEKKYKIHLGGEGGEFDTKVLNGPVFKSRIVLTDVEKQWDGKTHTGHLIIKDAKAVPKSLVAG